MAVYFVNRLLAIIPFGLLAVLLIFVLFESTYAPPQPQANDAFSDDQTALRDSLACEQRARLKLNLPAFYFSIRSSALPASLSQICNDQERNLIKMLCLHNGNTAGAVQLVAALKALKSQAYDPALENAFRSKDPENLRRQLRNYPMLMNAMSQYENNPAYYRVYLPRMAFSLTENRFHQWFSKILIGNFGRSTLDNQLVTDKIHSAMGRTLIFTLPAVAVIFLISISLGYYMTVKKGAGTSALYQVLYFLDAIPSFWLSIIILLLAGALGLGYSTLDFGGSL